MIKINKFTISLIVITTLFLQVSQCSKINFDIYHTTDEINLLLQQLDGNCEGYSLNLANDDPDIYEVTLSSLESDKPLKALIIFGEHPRELISPETGLNFLKSLCGQSQFGDYELTQKIRDNYDLKLIINSNPNSRRLVEEGDYCKRENPNFVDINRNWGSHWEHVQDEQRQVNSGEAPFSEIETQVLKKIATDFSPNVFISIHSGTLGLYTPYAYTNQRAERNEEHMINIVSDIQKKYCKNCSVGAAGKEVGYLCPGTCLDYIYETLEADYSFAFEIYSNENEIHQALEGSSFLQMRSRNQRLRHTFRRSEQFRPSSCFLQSSSESSNDTDSDSLSDLFSDSYQQCFLFFNPESHDDYDFVIDNWTKALYETLNHVTDNKTL
ncbi:zinc carboxypeptidase family protein (macronuclear) [Tetrahymena thermophila SB210]|uniref:Zinc carboxypeptidase family protein n=1 Tax=Tetrahymena thermophila (strain SB210) TaxID=312017 RepID=I7MFT1_TETTS|nr:zinc carboxypeptidase family protein [Tetrahymena thermophila SB210]EAS00566.2 zinc carboxypeptidase family protein [Tetrahymena thermophila SB210]|eukprot:XP_001020811.2 zinc carboxypeptidase family protein [Tetrahymena thermophila SB210]